MEAKNNSDLLDLEVKSNKNSINFYIPNNDTLSKICFVDIKNPKLEGSAFEFVTGIGVGVNTKLGFTTGTYAYIDNEKYVEIEILPNLLTKWNHPETTMHKKLPAHIKYWFKQKKSRKGQTLLLQTPQTCFVRESDITFITNTGIEYDYIDETPIDETIKITNTQNSTYNDGEGNKDKDNTTLLLVAFFILKLLK